MYGGMRRYSVQSEDDIFSLPESWIRENGDGNQPESYLDVQTVQDLLSIVRSKKETQ